MAVITVLFGSARVGEYRVAHVPFVIGRDDSCDVTIENVGISREHCRILYDGRRFYIEDLGSANGIFVKGHKTRKTSITDGDEVMMGKYSFLFNHSSRDIAPEPMPDEQPSSPFSEDEKSRTSDPMMTFKMDARVIQEQISRADEPSGPQRASDVARTFGGGSASARSGQSAKVQTFRGGRPRRTFLGCVGRLIVFAFLLAVIGLAAYLALTSFGIVNF